MTCEEDERRLFREAADLAIRLQNDPSNAISVDMVRNWVARGPLHAATWARVMEIHGMTGDILAGQNRTEKPAARNVLFTLLVVAFVSSCPYMVGGKERELWQEA